MTFSSRNISWTVATVLGTVFRFNDDIVARYPDILDVADIFSRHAREENVTQDELDFALGWLMDNYERIDNVS